jgi:hypothetical protein
MRNRFQFTYQYLESNYKKVLDSGYKVITCADFVEVKTSMRENSKYLVNRVDIDFSVKKTLRIIEIFNSLNITGTFFLRLHAPEYNPFSFENYRIIKFLLESGHELGYHSEIVDQARIWGEDESECLKRDLDVINRVFNTSIKGVASHGGMTGLNNLDFWKNRKPSDFNLLYEAYDHEPAFNLFQESFYVSDSEWTRWKCYDKGKLIAGDNRDFAQHAAENHPLIHLLIHPDTYFENHFYENEK